MENRNKIYENELAPLVNRNKVKDRLYMFFLIFMIGLGVFAFLFQHYKGHGVTGMRDNVVWGVYIVMFVVFLGFSYSTALISAVLHLARVKWAKPVMRMLDIADVAAMVVAPLFIIYCIGRFDRIFNLFIFGRIQSPITWDVIAIFSDLVISVVFLFITFIKDFAILRDRSTDETPKWKQKIYRFFAFNYTGTEKQKKLILQATDILAAIIIPITIVAYSLLAWIFAMTLRPGWHSTIFAPYFVLTAVFSGIALLVVMLWFFRRRFNIKKYLTKKHFNFFGYALLILCLIYGYFTFSEYFTHWYSSESDVAIWLSKLLTFSEYGWMMLLQILLIVAIPMFFIGLPWFRNKNTIALSALCVIIGLIMQRYLILIPTQETTFLPIQSATGMNFLPYAPTWVEWMLTAGTVALFMFIFALLSKLVPIVSISDMQEIAEIKPLKVWGSGTDDEDNHDEKQTSD